MPTVTSWLFTLGEMEIAVLFRRGKQDGMTKDRTTRSSMDEVMARTGKTRPDAPEGPSLGPDFWRTARIVQPEGPKQQLTLRLDPDIVRFFKKQGKGYQTRINAVLRSFVNAQRAGPHSDRTNKP